MVNTALLRRLEPSVEGCAGTSVIPGLLASVLRAASKLALLSI